MTVETSPSPWNVSFAKQAPETVTEPLTTIHDLPVEILLCIFSLNTRHDFYHIHNPSRTTRHTSQVCKRWRYIALNCPALWAQSIDFKDPMVWIKKVTTRCGTLPIDMIIPSVTDSLIKSCVGKESENLHRTSARPLDLIRRWDLPMCFDAKVLAPWFFHLPECRNVALKIPAAVWETFNLERMDLSHLESLTVVEAGVSLDPRLLRLWRPETFMCETPAPWNLRSLALSGCITAFSSQAFHHLSELTIHNVPIPLSLFPYQWLDVLKNVPALKHLELINTTLTPAYYNLDESETFSHSRTSVSLPYLERLHLDAPHSHCSDIFTHLEFPSSCNVTLVACGLSSIGIAFHLTVAKMELHLERNSKKSTPLASHSRSLMAAIMPSSCVINLTGLKNSQDNQDSGGSFSLSIRWNNSITPPVAHGPIDPLDVFSAVISAIRRPCANVTDLNLVVAVEIDDKKKHHAVLDNFLSSFDCLKSIEQISFSTLQFLLPFFDSRTDRKKTFGGLLPCLRAISFLDVNFANYNMGELSLLTILLSFVRSRLPSTPEDKFRSESNVGIDEKTPITDIRFRLCRAIREKAVKHFESFGVTVLRDGMSFGDVTVDGEMSKTVLHYKFS